MAWQALAALGGTLYSAQQAKNRAKDQMNFQRDMSGTAYQRAVADMRKAGINPIMASKLGGASTPTGAMAPTPDFGSLPEKITKSMATAKQVQLLDSQIKNTQAQTNKTKSETKTIDDKNSYEFGTYEGLMKQQQHKNVQLQGDLLRQNISKAKLENELRSFENNWFINTYGAPKATLTAKVQNYVLSKAFTKLSKKDEDKLITQIHRATMFATNNVEMLLNNPEILITMFGTMAGSFVIDQLMKTIKPAGKNRRKTWPKRK